MRAVPGSETRQNRVGYGICGVPKRSGCTLYIEYPDFPCPWHRKNLLSLRTSHFVRDSVEFVRRPGHVRQCHEVEIGVSGVNLLLKVDKWSSKTYR
jgi:hypothetical protein